MASISGSSFSQRILLLATSLTFGTIQQKNIRRSSVCYVQRSSHFI